MREVEVMDGTHRFVIRWDRGYEWALFEYVDHLQKVSAISNLAAVVLRYRIDVILIDSLWLHEG